MDTPSIRETKQLLAEAETLNPGPWVAHSIYTAEAARNIARSIEEMDPRIAYILGYLHDIASCGLTGGVVAAVAEGLGK